LDRWARAELSSGEAEALYRRALDGRLRVLRPEYQKWDRTDPGKGHAAQAAAWKAKASAR